MAKSSAFEKRLSALEKTITDFFTGTPKKKTKRKSAKKISKKKAAKKTAKRKRA